MRHDRSVKISTVHHSEQLFSASDRSVITLIDPCGAYLAHRLQLADGSSAIRHCLSVSDLRGPVLPCTSLVVLCARTYDSDGAWFGVEDEVASLKLLERPPAFAVIANGSDADDVSRCLREGARGYILATLPPKLMLRALHLIVAGAVVVPPAAAAGILARGSTGSSIRIGDFISRLN